MDILSGKYSHAKAKSHMERTQDQPIEIEAKFSIADPRLLHDLAKPNATLPGYRFGAPATRELVDIYLDTPDYRLLRHGFHLRVRCEEGQWLATLKARGVASDVGIYHRLEIEEPLALPELPAKIADLPAPIEEVIAKIVGRHQPLTAICVLEQTKQVRAVSAAVRGRKEAEPQPLARLSLDETVIRLTTGGAALAHMYEIEIELATDVDLAELQVLADRFMGVYGLTPSTESKLEHALGLIGRHPVAAPEYWQGIRPEMHMGEACRIIWHEQLLAVLLNEAGLRHGADPEYVHDARVAIRRARAAARIYRSFFELKAVRHYLKRLRKTAQLLGAVRDMDVAIAKLVDYQSKARGKRRRDIQATMDGWLAKRTSAHHALVEWLDSEQFAEFLMDVLQFCRTPGSGLVDLQPVAGKDVTPFQVRHVAPTMLLTNFERVRAYEMWFDQPEEIPVGTLHRLRIECKYLRYNLEFVEGLLGAGGAEFIAQLRQLQDDLGDLNDAVVSKQLLSAAETGKTTLARYERAQEKLIQELSNQMRQDFAGFVAKENRLRLFAAIADL